jgi:hypothetical protein
VQQLLQRDSSMELRLCAHSGSRLPTTSSAPRVLLPVFGTTLRSAEQQGTLHAPAVALSLLALPVSCCHHHTAVAAASASAFANAVECGPKGQLQLDEADVILKHLSHFA